MSSLFDHARAMHQELVRDIIRWPDHKLSCGYMNPTTIANIRSERYEWLKTPQGRRMVELAAEVDQIIKEQEDNTNG